MGSMLLMMGSMLHMMGSMLLMIRSILLMMGSMLLMIGSILLMMGSMLLMMGPMLLMMGSMLLMIGSMLLMMGSMLLTSCVPNVFSVIRVTRSLVLCVCFVDRCLSFCPFSFWSLCCLFFFDIQILISLLVSSNASSCQCLLIGHFRLPIRISHAFISQVIL
jgi:hypothetical protein